MLRPGPEVPEDVRLTALAYVSIVELGLMMQANGHPLRLPSDTITKTAAAETAAKNFLTLINTLGGALGIPAVTHLDQIFEIHGLDGLLAAIGQSLELTMTPVPREQAVVFPEPVRRTGVIPGLAVEAAGTALNEAAYYYDALGFPDWTRAREQAFTLLGEKGELAAKLTPALGWFKTMRKLDKK
jgi:hypothetical protein